MGDVVALAGDWHGDRIWARDTLRRVATYPVRTIFHLGDFGLWPGPSGKAFLNVVERECDRAGIEIWVL